MADAGLARFDYRLGGHDVHSSASTDALNVYSRGGKSYQLTGPTNVALGDPAAVALTAVLAATSAIVYSVADPPEVMNLVILHARWLLSLKTTHRFGKGQALVEQREGRVQARLVRQRPRGEQTSEANPLAVTAPGYSVGSSQVAIFGTKRSPSSAYDRLTPLFATTWSLSSCHTRSVSLRARDKMSFGRSRLARGAE